MLSPQDLKDGLDAVVAFQIHIARASRLTVDGDERSAKLVVAAVVEAPEVLLSAADVGALAGLSLMTDDQKLLRQVVSSMARLEVSLNRMDRAYARASELIPGMYQALRAADVLDGLRALRDLARVEAVEGGGAVKASDLYLQTDQRLTQTHTLLKRTLTALDEVLAQRASSLLHTLMLSTAAAVLFIGVVFLCIVLLADAQRQLTSDARF